MGVEPKDTTEPKSTKGRVVLVISKETPVLFPRAVSPGTTRVGSFQLRVHGCSQSVERWGGGALAEENSV